jgi:hypothetical protein
MVVMMVRRLDFYRYPNQVHLFLLLVHQLNYQYLNLAHSVFKM